MTKDLLRRLDRLDGGASADVGLMSDRQLLRIISREMPNPASFLAKSEHEQNRDIERLINQTGSEPGVSDSGVEA